MVPLSSSARNSLRQPRPPPPPQNSSAAVAVAAGSTAAISHVTDPTAAAAAVNTHHDQVVPEVVQRRLPPVKGVTLTSALRRVAVDGVVPTGHEVSVGEVVHRNGESLLATEAVEAALFLLVLDGDVVAVDGARRGDEKVGRLAECLEAEPGHRRLAAGGRQFFQKDFLFYASLPVDVAALEEYDTVLETDREEVLTLTGRERHWN